MKGQTLPPLRQEDRLRSASLWSRLRTLGGVAILALLVWRVGAGPFLHGLRVVNGWAVVAAVGLGALTTLACAWRWTLVAGGLGIRLDARAAFAAYYRSLFLNSTLPGGVLGDVHRAVRHGRDAGDLGRGVRAVVWERSAGQVVQLVLTAAVLVIMPSPVRSHLPAVAAIAAAVALVVVLLPLVLPHEGPSRWARLLRSVAADVRNGLFSGYRWVGIILASAAVVAGHTATFLIAARTAGSTAPLAELMPLVLLVLFAMAVPLNVGGWGPREGAAAWAFGAAGLTVTQGVSTAVVYGVLAFAASLPGAVVLLTGWLRRVGGAGRWPREATPALRPMPVLEGAGHG
jgi:uncharacterized membrane protein YbhN (UPF0104 family)